MSLLHMQNSYRRKNRKRNARLYTTLICDVGYILVSRIRENALAFSIYRCFEINEKFIVYYNSVAKEISSVGKHFDICVNLCVLPMT